MNPEFQFVLTLAELDTVLRAGMEVIGLAHYVEAIESLGFNHLVAYTDYRSEREIRLTYSRRDEE